MSNLSQSLLRSPLIWGTALYLLFQWLLTTHLPGVEFLRRYTAGHPIEHVETYLFFFGLTWLTARFINLAAQRRRLARLKLPTRKLATSNEEEARAVLEYLDRLPAVYQTDYLVQWYRRTIEAILRDGQSAEDNLALLSEQEAQRRYRDYGLLRLIVWAIPILGFLGTVVGIAIALGNLSPSELEETLPLVMSGLTVAFDTTALALALSMLLMLAQFAVQRWEDGFLERVAQLTETEVVNRLAVGRASIPEVQALEGVISRWRDAATEWSQHSADLWEQSLARVEQHWRELVHHREESLQQGLAAALEQGLRGFAQELAGIQAAATAQWRDDLDRRQSQVSQQLDRLEELTVRLREIGEAWASLSENGAQLRKLEDALDRNLAAVASAKHFEQALATLAAAASLLSAHLQQDAGSKPRQDRGTGVRRELGRNLQRETGGKLSPSDVIRPTGEAA